MAASRRMGSSWVRDEAALSTSDVMSSNNGASALVWWSEDDMPGVSTEEYRSTGKLSACGAWWSVGMVASYLPAGGGGLRVC